MKLTQRNAPANEESVSTLAQRFNLPTDLIRLLFSRGFTTENDIDNFLYPEKTSFHDPFLLKGMTATVQRIKTAINNKEKIVIFSDYDADGICSAAILSLYFSSIGLNIFTHIPDRAGDGYGLNTEVLERIIDAASPDLIITCDCGISSRAEVEYVLDLGVDIIVTDHHAVGDTPPQCTVVNPHQKDCDYPYKDLCGAGIAFKLVQALSGTENSLQYLDMAAIATIADLVPLTGENRLIVKTGLNQINNRLNLGISRLLASLKLNTVSAQDIAFKIAPRINAAGRMGDASRAFDLLISGDLTEIGQIIKELEGDNEKRKQLSDKIYSSALDTLCKQGLRGKKSVALSSDVWEKGIIGIVAARLTGEFRRPSVIMVKSGECYKATARSIEGINIYDALNSLSDILIEFGGHSQAAGFSIKEENIAQFKQRFEEYINKFDDELFLPRCYYDISIDEGNINKELAAALEMLEPCGAGNPKPQFLISAECSKCFPCKSNPVHTQISTKNNLNMFLFSAPNKRQFLLGGGVKDIIIELQSLSPNGILSAVCREIQSDNLFIDDDLARASFIKTLNFRNKNLSSAIPYVQQDLKEIVKGIYGTLFIAGCKQTYQKTLNLSISRDIILREFIKSASKNNYNRLIVSPDFDSDLPLSLYDKIIFLDSPPCQSLVAFLASKTSATIYVPKDDNLFNLLKDIDLSREAFGRYFDIMRRNSFNAASISDYYQKIKTQEKDISLSQLTVCLTVFIDLELITVKTKNGFLIEVNKGVRAELASSSIYNYLIKKMTTA